jgi:hypothetical protein
VAIIVAGTSGCSPAAAAEVAVAMNDLKGVLSIVVIDEANTAQRLVTAGAVMLTPQHVAQALRSSSSSDGFTPAMAAALLDFLFKNHPLPPPPLDGLPLLPGNKPQNPYIFQLTKPQITHI